VASVDGIQQIFAEVKKLSVMKRPCGHANAMTPTNLQTAARVFSIKTYLLSCNADVLRDIFGVSGG